MDQAENVNKLAREEARKMLKNGYGQAQQDAYASLHKRYNELTRPTDAEKWQHLMAMFDEAGEVAMKALLEVLIRERIAGTTGGWRGYDPLQRVSRPEAPEND